MPHLSPHLILAVLPSQAALLLACLCLTCLSLPSPPKTHPSPTSPQYAYYEPLKDWYAAYNKPGAVVDYFEHHSPKEEWVVVLDSDMLLKTPFLPEELPLERGWAYAAHYDYLSGVNNQLAMRHVPEITPR